MKGMVELFDDMEREQPRAQLVPHLQGSPLSRRGLLARAAGIAGLAAISGAFPAGASASSSSRAKVGGEIDFLSWQGYDLPTVMKAWNKQHAVKFKSTYVSNNDEIPAKIKGGGGSYDLITYTHFYKEPWSALGILSELDADKIPNLRGELPFFRSDYKNYWVDKGGKWTGIPWTWGSIGVTWDDKVLRGGVKSYFDMLDPKFKGKVGIPDDPIGVWQTACVACGFDPARVTKPQNEKVKDFLRKLVAQTKTISPTFGDLAALFGSGDVVIAFDGWAALNVFSAQAGNKNVKSALPKEGGYTFADVYAIPSTANNEDTVYAWINDVLTPERNAAAAKNLVAGVTVKKAIKLLDAQTRSLYPYDKLDKFLEAADLYEIPPQKSDKYVTYPQMLTEWQAIKARA
jgi:spermidine/putrescine transport system substrate-binding protein